MTSPAHEPSLAEVQAEHPGWECREDVSGLYYAFCPDTGQHVHAEDPLDLRDQIKRAEARQDWIAGLADPVPRPRFEPEPEDPDPNL